MAKKNGNGENAELLKRLSIVEKKQDLTDVKVQALFQAMESKQLQPQTGHIL